MVVHGREVKFLLTVNASCEIAEMCPHGDMNRIGELFDTEQPLRKIQENNARVVCIMNAGYEAAQAFEQPGYEARPITVTELMTMHPADFKALVQEAVAAFNAGTKTTVEVEPDKKNETQA